MKAHCWSRGEPIYECVSMWKCRDCAAHCFGEETVTGVPSIETLAEQGMVNMDGTAPLPKDCDEAAKLVILGAFGWNPGSPNEITTWLGEFEAGTRTWDWSHHGRAYGSHHG